MGEGFVLDDMPESIWSGEFTMLGVTMHVHVLSDGSRVIDGPDLEAFFAALMEHEGPIPAEETRQYREFIGGALPAPSPATEKE